MAKRKMQKYRRKRRMSGVGALGGINFMETAGVIAGAVGGRFLNKVVPATFDKRIVGGGKIVLGAILPSLVSGQMKAVMTGVGNGLVANGSIELMTELGVLSGMDDMDIAVPIEGIEDVEFEDVTESVGADVLSADVLSGEDDLPVINGEDDIPVINGEDEY